MLALGRLLELTLAGREPAEKIQLTRDGIRLHWWGEGVLEVRPLQEANCPSVLLCAGVYGNQSAPLEVLDDLLQAIASGQIKPRMRILFVLANVQAIRRGVRWVDQDLKPLFVGEHALVSGYEALRANQLERYAQAFFLEAVGAKLHYDLYASPHASLFEPFAVCPYIPNGSLTKAEVESVSAFGVAALVWMQRQRSTFTAFTRGELRVRSMALDIGRAASQNCAEFVSRLGQWLAVEESIAKPIELFRVAAELTKYTPGFSLKVPESTEHFTPLQAGQLLAEDVGGVKYYADKAQMRAIYLNSKVAAGQCAGLLLEPLALTELAS